MKKPAKRQRRPKQLDDAIRLPAEIIAAMLEVMGRGGLTHIAAKADMRVSSFLKRTKVPGMGLDAATVRLLLLVMNSKRTEADGEPLSVTQHGGYEISLFDTSDGISPRWRKIK